MILAVRQILGRCAKLMHNSLKWITPIDMGAYHQGKNPSLIERNGMGPVARYMAEPIDTYECSYTLAETYTRVGLDNGRPWSWTFSSRKINSEFQY